MGKELTHEILLDMIRATEEGGLNAGYKKSTVDCDHKEFLERMNKMKIPHCITVSCSDCGSPFGFIGTEWLKEFHKLEKFKDFKGQSDSD